VRQAFDARLRAALAAGGIAWVDIAGSSEAEREAAALAALQRPSNR
jgi:hypothetical protein